MSEIVIKWSKKEHFIQNCPLKKFYMFFLEKSRKSGIETFSRFQSTLLIKLSLKSPVLWVNDSRFFCRLEKLGYAVGLSKSGLV